MSAGLSPELRAALGSPDVEMLAVLRDLIRLPSVSGREAPVVEYVAAWARARGIEADVWEAKEEELAGHPEAAARHLPLAGRPTCVLRVRGTDAARARSLMMNGHTDVVSAGAEGKWTHPPFSGEVVGNRVFGRGACDTKGPMVSAMWAMAALAQHPSAGDVMLELVPGEEDCVGLGTLTSVVRGYRADGAVILEPTESVPRCASRGGLRFEVTTHGRSVHGTVKWLGADAISSARKVLDGLATLEARYNDRDADVLFSSYPLARPITVDTVRAGEWQGMVADRCLVGGYFDLLPGDDLDAWSNRLQADLREIMGLGDLDQMTVVFPERYTGNRVSVSHDICSAAERALGPIEWQGFNSGCEAGLRARVHGTPTLIYGPGSLAKAHCVDEYVDFADVRRVAAGLAGLAMAWCGARRDSVGARRDSVGDGCKPAEIRLELV